MRRSKLPLRPFLPTVYTLFGRLISLREWIAAIVNPQRIAKSDGARLNVETMEDRVVPSGPQVLYSGTSELYGPDGTARVDLTVTANATGFDGLYLWDYQLTNDGFTNHGIGQFAVPVTNAAAIGNVTTTSELTGMVDGNGPAVEWSGGIGGPELMYPDSASFSFTTIPAALAGVTLSTDTADGSGPATGSSEGPGAALIAVQVVDGNQNQVTAPQNIEGDSPSLQVQASNPNNDTLTYSADNLPIGLSLDAATGTISGTIAAGDAASGDDGQGNYAVTINVTDGISSGSTTLAWSVLPRITVQLGNQQNLEGDIVNVQVDGSTPDNTTLTYSASNLPSGLSINSATGLITGSVAIGDATSGDDGEGDYAVSISATDGNYTGTITAQLDHCPTDNRPAHRETAESGRR